MRLQKMNRTALIAIAAFFLAAASATGAAAQTNMPTGVKNVLLIHGPWAMAQAGQR